MIDIESSDLLMMAKDLSRRGADLRGGLWAFRGNVWTRNSQQPQRGTRLMDARWLLQDALASATRRLAGLGWRSRLASFRDLARTIKWHFNGTLAYLETRLTNGVMEAFNSLLQLAKGTARSLRNFHYFRRAAYLETGGLNLQTPRLLPTYNV